MLLIYVCLYIFTFHIGFDGERSILDAIFDEDSLEGVLDVEMMDVEEKDLVGQDLYMLRYLFSYCDNSIVQDLYDN